MFVAVLLFIETIDGSGDLPSLALGTQKPVS